ncbi:L,D-transpeptidase catalytic domain [compost metagenome]
MEFAIFFNGGIALHAAHPELYKYLGRRASGGCVRQHYQDAEYLYNLARAQRSKNVLIVVEDF